MKKKIMALVTSGMMLFTTSASAISLSLKEYDESYTPKGASKTVVYRVDSDRLVLEGESDAETVYLFVNEDFKPIDIYDYPDLIEKSGIKAEVTDGKFTYTAPEPVFPLPINQGQLKYNTENQMSRRLIYNTYPNRFFAISVAEDGTVKTSGVVFVEAVSNWTNR